MEDLANAGTHELLADLVRSLEHEANLAPVPVSVPAPAPVPVLAPVPAAVPAAGGGELGPSSSGWTVLTPEIAVKRKKEEDEEADEEDQLDEEEEEEEEAVTEEQLVAEIKRITRFPSASEIKILTLITCLCAPAPSTFDRPHMILLDYVLQLAPITSKNIVEIKILLDCVKAELDLPYVRLAKSACVIWAKSHYILKKPSNFNRNASSPMGKLYTFAGTEFLRPAYNQRGRFDTGMVDLAQDMAHRARGQQAE